MLSRRKPMVALAAITAALAVAVPVTSASAATATPRSIPLVDPTVCQLLNVSELQAAPTALFGGTSLATVLTGAGNSVGCPGLNPQPTFPGLPGLPGLPVPVPLFP
jgi:hypothetical protein